jgi:hypothetical protein
MSRPASESDFVIWMQITAEETGIPLDQLWEMRPSELEPIFAFAKLKLELRRAQSQAEIDELEAQRAAELAAHPLWREHLNRKQSTKGERR